MHAAFAIFFCILHNSTFQRKGCKTRQKLNFSIHLQKDTIFLPWLFICTLPKFGEHLMKIGQLYYTNCPYFAKTFTVKVSSHKKHIAYITMSNNWKEVREWNLKEVFSLQRGLFLPAQGEMAELKGQQNTITLLSLSGANTVQREFLFQVEA